MRRSGWQIRLAKTLSGEAVALWAKSAEVTLPRKASKVKKSGPVPITDTGSRGEHPKVSERTLVKELGKMTP